MLFFDHVRQKKQNVLNKRLIMACQSNNILRVEKWLRYGACIDAPLVMWAQHMIPLTIAITYGHYALAQRLIELGANPNGYDGINVSPLLWIIQSLNMCFLRDMISVQHLCETLVKKGARVNERVNENITLNKVANFTLLHRAVETGHSWLVTLLLDAGASFDVRDENDRLPEDLITHMRQGPTQDKMYDCFAHIRASREKMILMNAVNDHDQRVSSTHRKM